MTSIAIIIREVPDPGAAEDLTDPDGFAWQVTAPAATP